MTPGRGTSALRAIFRRHVRWRRRRRLAPLGQQAGLKTGCRDGGEERRARGGHFPFVLVQDLAEVAAIWRERQGVKKREGENEGEGEGDKERGRRRGREGKSRRD